VISLNFSRKCFWIKLSDMFPNIQRLESTLHSLQASALFPIILASYVPYDGWIFHSKHWMFWNLSHNLIQKQFLLIWLTVETYILRLLNILCSSTKVDLNFLHLVIGFFLNQVVKPTWTLNINLNYVEWLVFWLFIFPFHGKIRTSNNV